MTATFPPEFNAPCTACTTPVGGPDVACSDVWETPAGYDGPGDTRCAVWCVECHDGYRCDCPG